MRTEDITRARKGRKVRDCGQEESVNTLVDIFANCYLAKGQKKEAADLVVMATTAYNQIMREYSGFTLEEIALASNEAVFNGTKYISPADMIQWMRDYRMSDIYRQAREQSDYNPLQLSEFKGPDITEDQAAMNLLRADFDYLVKHREFPKGRFGYPRGEYCYNYLVKKNKISKDSYRAFAKEGRKLLSARSVFDASLSPSMVDIYSKFAAVDNYLMRMAAKEWEKAGAEEDLPE